MCYQVAGNPIAVSAYDLPYNMVTFSYHGQHAKVLAASLLQDRVHMQLSAAAAAQLPSSFLLALKMKTYNITLVHLLKCMAQRLRLECPAVSPSSLCHE